MKFTEFDYVDSKGKETHRKLLVTQEPTDKLAGIDVTESNDTDIALIAVAYNEALTDFLARVESLKVEFDVKHNFRQFFPDSMANVKQEYL